MGYLRLILALSVVLWHAGSILGFRAIDGLVAVHVFFIISGFYMTLIIKTKYSKTKRPYFNFISNRFLRIFPIYWIILLLSIIVHFFVIYNLSVSGFLNGIISLFTNYLNSRKITGVIEDITLLVRTDYLSPDMFRYDSLLIGPAWTLVLEFIFYIFAPFLVFLRKRYLALFFLFSLATYYLITHFHYLKGDHYIQTFFVPANFWFFLAGIFSFSVYEYLKKEKIKIRFPLLISLVFLSLIVLWNYIPGLTFRWIILKEWFLYLLTPFMLPVLFESFALIPLNNLMADLSYAVYISHILTIDFLQTKLGFKIGSEYFSFWAVLLTLAVSIFLVYLIEKPIDRFRQRRIRFKA